VEILLGKTLENSGKQNLKTGFKPPRAEMPSYKWLSLKNLGSKTLEQIQNLDPHRLMSRLKIQVHFRRHSSYSAITPIDVWIQKMDIDGDGGRREFGLRGQRRGTESDKGTAANSLFGNGKIAAQQSAMPLPTNPLPSVKS
jgi:hypothetical protein